MKYILIISLLFISCIVCKGQYIPDSLHGIIATGTFGVVDSAWISNEKKLGRTYNVINPLGFTTSNKRYKTDTIKIIYQYSDTAKILEFETLYSIDTTTGKVSSTPTLINSIGYYDNKVRWSNGYVVTESTIYSFRRVCYLDKDKQPLYKNIIVWKYIEIE